MSDKDQKADSNNSVKETGETGGVTAHMRKTPWRGWIWAVPLAALILVGYLVIRTWLLAGPTVTVTFPTAENVSSKGTAVQYKGVQVGTVEDVSLSADKKSVIVTIGMNSSASDMLREGTKFWVAKPSLLSGDLAGLLSGAHIKMQPADNNKGKSKYHFKGLLKSPPKKPTYPGKKIIVYAKDAGTLSRGASVLYHGVQAGKVLDIVYDKKSGQVKFSVFVRKNFTKYLNNHTRFWRAGGLGISSQGGGAQFQLPKMAALLKGAIAFNSFANTISQSTYHLYDSQRQATNILSGPWAKFALRFYGSTNGIKAGDSVTLAGRKVGMVDSVGFKYDVDEQKIVQPVVIKIYAKRLGIGKVSKSSNKKSDKQQRKSLKQAITKMVKNGLVGQISSSSFILGSKQIALTMTDKKLDQSDIKTGENGLLQIPAGSGGGLQDIIGSVSQITDKVNEVPIDKIADNVNQAISKLKDVGGNVDKLINSKKVQKSIDSLEKSLSNIKNITNNAQGKIAPTIKSLHTTADSITALSKTIKKVLIGSSMENQSVDKLLAELTQAARSIRTLANYLDRHPEALLQGRSK